MNPSKEICRKQKSASFIRERAIPLNIYTPPMGYIFWRVSVFYKGFSEYR